MKRKILILLAWAVLALGAAGCSRLAEVKDVFTKSQEGSGKKEETEADETELEGEEGEVQKACDAFFEAYTSLDGEEAGKMIHYGDPITFSRLQGALSENIQVEISSVAVDGDDAEVTAEITNIDMAAIIEDLPEDVSSKEEAAEAMVDAISHKDAPTAVFEVTLLFTRVDGQWLIEMTPELSDAVLGGYQSFLNRLLEEMES